MMRLSLLVEDLKPSPTLAISYKAQAMRADGTDVIDLSIGEPDFLTPPPICEAAKRALDEGWTKYAPVAGFAKLRQRIAQMLQEKRGLFYQAEQIVVSAGAKQCLYNAIRALIGPGDEVIIPSPYWVSYPSQVHLAGGLAVYVATDASDHFQIDPDAIRRAITSHTRMIILNSPNNPTGAVYQPDRLAKIAQLAIEYDLCLLSDEVYDDLVYTDTPVVSPIRLVPEVKERAILINGFSKSCAMTGWRIGYMAAPEAVVKAAVAIQSACTSGVNSMTQIAAHTALALGDDFRHQMCLAFRARLDYLLNAFDSLSGISCSRPGGAFYLLPDFRAYLGKFAPNGQRIDNTVQLATYLLEEGHIALVPGESFGAPGYLRLSYAADIEILRQFVDRLRDALYQLH